jgi:hypothetical protein
MVGKGKNSVITLEYLMERMEALDANANARIDILQVSWNKKCDQQFYDLEITMEGRILKLVNDQEMQRQ